MAGLVVRRTPTARSSSAFMTTRQWYNPVATQNDVPRCCQQNEPFFTLLQTNVPRSVAALEKGIKKELTTSAANQKTVCTYRRIHDSAFGDDPTHHSARYRRRRVVSIYGVSWRPRARGAPGATVGANRVRLGLCAWEDPSGWKYGRTRRALIPPPSRWCVRHAPRACSS